jgi:predicted acetyltransferase
VLTSTDITIRSVGEAELERFLETVEVPFGEEAHEEDVERWKPHLNPERQFWALDGDVPVGTAGAYEKRMAIPGGEVAIAAVTMVGVHPSHRRRGILTQLMRRQLDDAHERGEPVAALWATEATIYGRYGYGLATTSTRIEADRDRMAFRAPDTSSGRTRLVGDEEAKEVIPPLFDRVQAETPGMLSRDEAWWTSFRLADPERWRHGAGPLFRAVWEGDDGPQAYALYRIKGSWEDGVPGGKLNVREALGVTPQATREIWRFLFGVDLVRQVEAFALPPDHPLFLAVGEPRRLKMTAGDGVWVRLLDLEAALGARSYASDGTVVFEVGDRFCDWNAGIWRLAVQDGEATASRSDDEPDLRLDVGDVASPYLGGFTFAQLQRAGRVDELRSGAIATADALFQTAAQPWCPEIF